MKTRLITAAVGVPFLIFVLVVRGWFAELVIALLTIIAMRECYRALGKAGYNVCTWGGYAAAVAMWPLSRVMGVLDPLLLVVAAMGISMTGVMLREKPTFPDAAASVYPLFTCFLPMSMFMMMMNSTYGVVPGIALITMAFAIAYVGDGAAYFGGRAMGKHKLCPNVSPKKTVEGAIFGVVGGTIGGLICPRGVCIRVPHADAGGSGGHCAGPDRLGGGRNRRPFRVAAQAPQRNQGLRQDFPRPRRRDGQV